jgi:predicted  nucleic acid-binding Zn-ribbon protein
MSIREQPTEVEPEGTAELDDALAAADSARRQLDVAEGREKRLREQVELLEVRLLEAEKEITALHREIRGRAELGAQMRRTLSWRVTKPLRAGRRLLRRP